MALAILRFDRKEGGQYVMEADIGTNAFYEFKIGHTKRKYKGLEFVDEVTYQSAMLKSPVTDRESFRTEFRFNIAASLFDKDSRFIQLFSYKDRNKKSPAISEVATVIPAIADLDDNFKLPKMMTTQQEIYHHPSVGVRNSPFRLKENKVSEAFFFNTLLGALPGILNTALPIIGKLLPGLQGATPAEGKEPDAVSKLLPELLKVIPQDVKPGAEGVEQVLKNISPDTIKAILEVIQAQMGKGENGTNGVNGNAGSNGNGHAKAASIVRYSHDFAINPATLMQLAPLLEKVLSPETIKAIGDNPVKLFKAVSDSALKFQKMELDHLEKINPGVDDEGFDKVAQGMSRTRQRYSRAKIAPALLAALPALMPVLEKVLSPDMIKAIGDQPVKLFNAIADAGLKHTQQELEHLERINPGVDDPAFDNIVNSMSVKSAVAVKATFSDSVSIKFLNARTTMMAGKEKVLYDKRQKVTLPVQLNTNGKVKSNSNAQSIPKGIFQLIVQDPDNMEVLLEKKYKVKDVVLNAPVSYISLSSDDIKALPSSKDLKLELTFNWRKGENTYGTFMNHYITLSDGYIYQRVGNNTVSHFALNDVNRFRDFWHKVWEGGPTSHERWKIDFECKYYYHTNEEDSTIKKLATRKQVVSDSAGKTDGEDNYRRKIAAKLKSGMEVSLEGYNQLLQLHEQPPVSAEQLSAFKSQSFAKDTALVARVSVDFRGRKGETAALWTYPEGNIQTFVLSKIMATDPTGLVTQVQEEEVHFPKFSSVHFIGTQSN